MLLFLSISKTQAQQQITSFDNKIHGVYTLFQAKASLEKYIPPRTTKYYPMGIFSFSITDLQTYMGIM